MTRYYNPVIGSYSDRQVGTSYPVPDDDAGDPSESPRMREIRETIAWLENPESGGRAAWGQRLTELRVEAEALKRQEAVAANPDAAQAMLDAHHVARAVRLEREKLSGHPIRRDDAELSEWELKDVLDGLALAEALDAGDVDPVGTLRAMQRAEMVAKAESEIEKVEAFDAAATTAS